MRGWKIFGGKSSSDDNVEASDDQVTADSGASRPFQDRAASPQRRQDAFIGFMHQRSSQDAKMERLVAAAARSLGEGVQQIVMAAKAKQANKGEWKEQLIQLLTSADDGKPSDVDTLLENSSCEKFVLRCVEAELPPNLVHCLRLLRVLELQHAAEGENVRPLGEGAARKVSKLLCLLCTDPVVGEQLRPHLFGLLALSGASYPPTGVHVARAASEVIIAFAEFCLSRQLVFFIHDRKMILHMTDDIKELCGMTDATSGAPAVPNGLTEQKAEEAGLWAIAFRTVVMLVAFSCRQQTVDLVKDFEAAGGFKLLRFAINRSSEKHGKELLNMLPILACCPNEAEERDFDSASEKLATNLNSFDTMEDFLHRSNPLLHAYQLEHNGERPDLDVGGALASLAELSIKTAITLRTQDGQFVGEDLRFNIAPEYLEMTLQLFSDHLDNYDHVEGRLHTLTYWLLALPCVKEEGTKIFILKMLEFVLTSVGVSNEVMPVHAIIEIFFALCKTMLRGRDALSVPEDQKDTFLELLSKEIDLIGETLEKLLQFDQRVAPVMVESGIMTEGLDEMLDLIENSSGDPSDTEIPPKETRFDKTFVVVCNVLKLLVSHQPTDVSSVGVGGEKTNIHRLLRVGSRSLGSSACFAAAGVFESFMRSFSSVDSLIEDVNFVFGILEYLSSLNRGFLEGGNESGLLSRQTSLLSSIRSVSEGRSLARDAFRAASGFDKIIDILLTFTEATTKRKDFEEMFGGQFLLLLQSIISLIEAAIGSKSKSPMSNTDTTPLLLPSDISVDNISSQISYQSPSAKNLFDVRRSAFYLQFAAALSKTGILDTRSRPDVMDAAFSHVDVSLVSRDDSKVTVLRNPDAVKLLLGLILFFPSDEMSLQSAREYLDRILSLVGKDRSSSTLAQIASTGLCSSLTNPDEYAPILFCKDFPLRDKYLQLLIRVASFGASEHDTVSLLRCLAGPTLESGKEKNIRLPFISSSINRKALTSQLSTLSTDDDEDQLERLEILKTIARESDRYFRLQVGGDSINTIGVLMHKVKLEERLRAAAESGRLKYLEIECLDSSSLVAPGSAPPPPTSPTSADKVWAPLIGSGFTYSLWLKLGDFQDDSNSGNLYILDISSPSLTSSSNQTATFLTIWYDIQNQRFNVMSSTSYRMEPISFPVSPLGRDVWHHIMVTYNPSKRSVISRKSVFCLYVDGRPLEADVRVDSPPLPPNSKVLIGSPNPSLAASGIVRGKLPVWEMGPVLLLSTILLDLDATALFAYGPTFPGLVWGDRPEQESLSAIATSLFSMLSDTAELGSIATALRRRDVAKLESAGAAIANKGYDMGLSSVSLNCQVTPDCVVFAFQASTLGQRIKNGPSASNTQKLTQRLVNLARAGFDSESVATDGLIVGRGSAISPKGFSDNLRWLGGPMTFLPVVNFSVSPNSLASALDILRTCVRRHRPNLEAMQAKGGYRVLAVLLQEKTMIDARCLDQCLAFAIHGFDTKPPVSSSGESDSTQVVDSTHASLPSEKWILIDVDAMKHLVLNHQVWDLKKYGPAFPLRIVSALNLMVDHISTHKAFNARRLHMVGIVKWCIHMMIESSELFSVKESSSKNAESWVTAPSKVSEVMVGGDAGNPFLKGCKNLLRRVLTFMLTPGDLESLAESTIYTVTAGLNRSKPLPGSSENEEDLHPYPTMRLYLIRLLEELIVDGVNEIIISSSPQPVTPTKGQGREAHVLHHGPHRAGIASPGQPYLTSTPRQAKDAQGIGQAKHTQAQAFLSAFAGYLTPAWFATILEGCKEEATASAVLRLLILLLQGSTAFESAFFAAGSFSPFVISLPKYSASPGIILPLLSYLLRVPILHIHSLPTLDSDQLCEIFDSECDETTPFAKADISDPAGGVVALLAECLGRNAEIVVTKGPGAAAADQANKAIYKLLAHRIEVSLVFQEYCAGVVFIEPMAQALCLCYNDQTSVGARFRTRRRSCLADVPRDLTPTERFIGPKDSDMAGIWIIRLLQSTIAKSLSIRPGVCLVARSVLRSIPIHATFQQVEAYHLIMIETFRSIITTEFKQGSSLVIANCIGLCSVLLDSLLMGFFTSEAVLETAKLMVDVLNLLIDGEFDCSNSLSSTEQLVFFSDAAHMARLTLSTAMRISLGGGQETRDEDLQSEILSLIDTNFKSIFLIPDGKKLPSGPFPKQPTPTAKLYPLWNSTSLARCDPPVVPGYPDLKDCAKPEHAALAPLLVSLHTLLVQSREDVRGLAISVLVSLLQHCQRTLGDLLVVQVDVGGVTETIDVVNRGGFRALLAAHEAATISDNTSAQTSVKRRYASFFEWFDKNQQQVQRVFQSVDDTAFSLFPGLDRSMSSPDEAIEEEQQEILKKSTSSASSDRALLGTVERAELANFSSEKVSDNHAHWKRQGFDDLAFGAMRWKVFLRQSKGPFSIWEGGPNFQNVLIQPEEILLKRKSLKVAVRVSDFVKHWKLDLTEGYERQRRRLLPNYEFSSLYNIDEEHVEDGVDDVRPSSDFMKANEGLEVVAGTQMEATTELLKDLNIKRVKTSEEDEFDLEGLEEDGNTVASTATNLSGNEASSVTQDSVDGNTDGEMKDEVQGAEKETTAAAAEDGQEESSSYELISGLLQAGDKPEKCYNVQRCTGLEVTKAILLWCNGAVYVIDGFEQSEGDGMDGTINRVEREQSSFKVALRSKDFIKREESEGKSDSVPGTPKAQRVTSRSKSSVASDLNEDVIYQHRSQRISFEELAVVYRRRYQLQQNALEFYDTNHCATLIAFNTHDAREEVLTKVLQSKLPNSIFNSNYGSYISYTKFMSYWKAKVVAQWTSGKMSNFDFLMHLNSFAGRTFNDLTQYPVFPWVIADYESEEIDLEDPKTYRDLSKPMGAIGEERAKQFRDRYEALVSTSFGEDDPPPFHYGTHYSSAAYVLYYLIRLEPFSRLALLLQGGKFDVADRLFHDVGRSWKSASSENLQDVRELVPEFFYLPDFLTNTNHFDYGETQKGKTVHDVTLPPWAKGDPERFVRINRQALESEYVSKNLHQWADLIFGFKQRGEEAIAAQNTFVHVTYEGEVDLDSLSDPVERASIIAQIQNFGQTPSRLERRPFPPRTVPKMLNERGGVDFTNVTSLAQLTPPLCVAGAPHWVRVKSVPTDSVKLGMEGQRDLGISDVCLNKGQLLGVGRMCSFMPDAKKYIRFGSVGNGISVYTATLTTRHRELNKLLTIHDALHSSAIVAAKTSDSGDWIVTGSVDSTIRAWKYDGTNLQLKKTLVGHDGYHIQSIDICTEFGLIVSASSNGRVLIWDLRSLSFLRALHQGGVGPSQKVSVSINHSNGNIVTLVDNAITIFSVNGTLVGTMPEGSIASPISCITASNCPEWMEEGIVVASGHESGEIRLWSLDYDKKELRCRGVIDDGYHSSSITALRITGTERQDTLLVGDSGGRMSVYKVVSLDTFTSDELKEVAARLKKES